ncbi:MAG: protein kinase, partial [Candidatus Eisenbacteria bacterium]
MTQKLSHYILIEQIGAGGMGVVHRARDERLERDVAIKLLPAGMLADEAARSRFRREALALSRLNHPNIATVHDFDFDKGVDFLVMEWVPGETLERRVARGPAPEAELLPIAIQVAEALVSAHASGVIHRDLKPANLRVTPDGRVKVLDFGLARLTRQGEDARTATATAAGITPGTLAYMPPETFSGKSGGVSGDLYSLGVVLYELATARLPFEGQHVAETIHAILHGIAVPPRAVQPAVTEGFQNLVMRLLQRDPSRRYAGAAELLADLRLILSHGPGAVSAATEPIRSLAVLPLENLSGDPAQEYFADGMTEALISDIARLRELRVISRTSVMRYKGARKPIAEIASELRVDSVLEGSVARAGDRVRVSVQLIDARTETHLWSERYDRAMQDVLELQSDVAKSVAREIRAALLEAAVPPAAPLPGAPRMEVLYMEVLPMEDLRGASFEGDPATEPPPPGTLAAMRGSPVTSRPPRRVDPEAYDAFLRARHHLDRRSDDSLHKALEHLRTAIDRDPTFAMAHVAQAEALGVLGFHEFEPPRDVFPRARAAAKHAIELEPNLGEAHAVLGYVHLHHDWDWKSAERSFLRALELNPHHATTRLWYVNLLIASGRLDEALAEARASVEHDPLSLILNLVTGWVYFYRREFDLSFREMGRPLELEPNFFQPHQWRGWSLHLMGRDTEAAEHLEVAAGLIHHRPTELLCKLMSQVYGGNANKARAILAQLEHLGSNRYVSAFSIMLGHLSLGDREESLNWLEKARDQRSPWIGFLNHDPRVDALRGDPRFEAIRALAGQGESSA